MDSSVYSTIGIGVGVVIIVGWTVFKMMSTRRPKLPTDLPPFGPLPLNDLPQYYEREERAVAWERIRGWQLNEKPPSWSAPASVDHVVVTPRFVDFCSGTTGELVILFDFLAGAILNVQFEPAALPAGIAPPGSGLVTVQTPSGLTHFIASQQFAQTLQTTVASARASGV